MLLPIHQRNHPVKQRSFCSERPNSAWSIQCFSEESVNRTTSDRIDTLELTIALAKVSLLSAIVIKNWDQDDSKDRGD